MNGIEPSIQIALCADPIIEIPIAEIIIHANFDIKSKVNDIALIRLNRKVQYSDSIQPICLPLTDNLKSSSLEDQVSTQSGWGQTRNGIYLKSFAYKVLFTESRF